MTVSRRLSAVVVGMGALILQGSAVPLSHADPLTPLTPNEIQYLDAARQVFAVSRDPASSRDDGQTLLDGRYACGERDNGLVGYPVTYVSPILTQLAFAYLCPR